jgi:DNA-binding transcriptional LysR family regulator
LELRAVDHVLAIALHGSLSAAAKALGLSQPALTKAVRRLEEECGVPLFDRGARGVSLTVYGEAFLRHARNLRASLREAREEMEALRHGAAGRVRLGAGPSWQGMVLPEAITLFRAARPAVRIRVVGGMDQGLKDQLREGALDFVLAAIGDTPPPEPDLLQKALLADHYLVVAALDHPLRARPVVTLADLLAFPWILPGPGTAMVERLRVMFRARGLAPPEAVIETDIQALKVALMRSGDYLSFHAAGHLAGLAVPEIRPLPVEGGSWRREAGIITRKGVEPNPAAQALIAVIEGVCARHAWPGAAA